LSGISPQRQTEVTLPTIADTTFKTVDLDLILQAGLRLSQDKALSWDKTMAVTYFKASCFLLKQLKHAF